MASRILFLSQRGAAAIRSPAHGSGLVRLYSSPASAFAGRCPREGNTPADQGSHHYAAPYIVRRIDELERAVSKVQGTVSNVERAVSNMESRLLDALEASSRKTQQATAPATPGPDWRGNMEIGFLYGFMAGILSMGFSYGKANSARTGKATRS